MTREGVRGITRPARPKGGRTGIRAKARPAGRLGLDGQGLQAPNKRKEVSAVHGWLGLRKGWTPTGRDRHRRAWFTTARPVGVRIFWML